MTENISTEPSMVLLKSGCECPLGSKHPKVNLRALWGRTPTMEPPHCNSAPSSWPLVHPPDLDSKSIPIFSYCWGRFLEDNTTQTIFTWPIGKSCILTFKVLASPAYDFSPHWGLMGVHLSQAGRHWTHISFFHTLFHCFSTLALRDSCSAAQENIFLISSLLLLKIRNTFQEHYEKVGQWSNAFKILRENVI